MVVSNINLLCVDSVKILKFQLCNASVRKFNRNLTKKTIYRDRYIDVQKMSGIWYQIEPKSRLSGNYGNEFFDLAVKGEKYYAVFNDSSFKEELINLINSLFATTPKNLLIFFIDLQAEFSDEQSLGLSNFINDIKCDQIKFNTIYKISRNAEHRK